MIKQYYQKTNTLSEFNISIENDRLQEVLSEKGYTIYTIVQKTNQLIPYHDHPSEEMVVVLSGSIRYIIEEEIVDLEAGDVIKIAPHSVHAMVGTSDNGYSNIILVFI